MKRKKLRPRELKKLIVYKKSDKYIKDRINMYKTFLEKTSEKKDEDLFFEDLTFKKIREKYNEKIKELEKKLKE